MPTDGWNCRRRPGIAGTATGGRIRTLRIPGGRASPNIGAMTTPSYPAAPQNNYFGGAAPRPVAPGTIKGAFIIYLVAAVLAVVGIVLTVTSDVWKQAVADAGDRVDTSGMSASAVANTAKIIVIVIGVVLVGVYLLFAFKMRAGRNWARIVLTVFSVLSIGSSARGSGSMAINGRTYEVASSQTSGWIGSALAIVAIVLMFLPASNAYMSASRAARQVR